jgi:hypothetical protein
MNGHGAIWQRLEQRLVDLARDHDGRRRDHCGELLPVTLRILRARLCKMKEHGLRLRRGEVREKQNNS